MIAKKGIIEIIKIPKIIRINMIKKTYPEIKAQAS
jgi:hypothetical protein